jgi:hypothetical protein
MKEAKAAQEAADLEKSAAAPAVITTEMLESHAIAAPKRRSNGAKKRKKSNLKYRPLKPMSGWSAHRYRPT